jgi:cholesterol transport system auxiliary component
MNMSVMKPLAFVLPAVLAAALLGCASPGGADAMVHVYDLGLAPQAVPAEARIAARIAQVRANAPFDGTEMQYRLSYRDSAELLSFSQSRWAAPPAELVRKRLIRSADPAPGNACSVDIEILEFSQVFSAPNGSEALLEMRVALAGGSARLAERSLRIALPQAGATASQGAVAMARAVENGIAQLAAWVGQQPACKMR